MNSLSATLDLPATLSFAPVVPVPMSTLERVMQWKEESQFGALPPFTLALDSSSASSSVDSSHLSARLIECLQHIIECVRGSHDLERTIRAGDTKLSEADVQTKVQIKAMQHAWMYLVGIFEESKREKKQDATLIALQQAVVDHTVLLLMEHALFFDNLDSSVLPALLTDIIDWLGTGDAGTPQMDARIELFTRVWTVILNAEEEADAKGLKIPIQEFEDSNSSSSAMTTTNEKSKRQVVLRPTTDSSLTFLLLIGCTAGSSHTNLLTPTHLHPLRALRVMTSIPALARQLIVFPQFLSPWINGWTIESQNMFGIFFRASPLPDDPVVGERYFSNGMSMPQMELVFVMKTLFTKLNSMHEVLTDVIDELLGTNEDQVSVSRYAILSWLSVLLLGNWSRTKLRAARRQTSNDGYLLNVGSVMLKLATRRKFLDITTLDQIDPLYSLYSTRLELKDETKLAASTAEETAWIRGEQIVNGKFQQRGTWKNASSAASSSSSSPSISSSLLPSTLSPTLFAASSPPPTLAFLSPTLSLPSSSDSLLSSSALSAPSSSPSSLSTPFDSTASAYLSMSLGETHEDVICDLCRTRNFTGSRNKCAQCKDYDLCDSCATKEYAESLKLIPRSGVTFSCPYNPCSLSGLTEHELFSHISSQHSEDTRIVSCPVCRANVDQSRHPFLDPGWCMYSNPDYLIHFTQEHSSAHDSKHHVLIKCPRTVLHVMHKRLFTPCEKFGMVYEEEEKNETEKSSATSSASSSPPTAELAAMHLHSPPPSSTVAAAASPNPFPLPAQLLDFLDIGPAPTSSSASSATVASSTSGPPAYVTDCARIQSAVIHHGVTCAECGTKDIRGVHYRCTQCENYSLCQACESRWSNGAASMHPSWHTFLVFRRPLHSPASKLTQLPMSIFYPGAVTDQSSYPNAPKFSLRTQWVMMILHTFHAGLIRTLVRYTSLAQALDGEQDARKINSLLQVRLCVDAQLMQADSLVAALDFYVVVARWIRRIIDPTHTGLPLSSSLPMEYASLPEYFIDDISEYLLFLSRFSLETFERCDILPIIELFVLLISTPAYMTNPYLRSKLVECFCSLCDNAENVQATFTKTKPQNNIKTLFSTNPFIVNNLLPSLIRLYVDIEHGGSDSQFYTKFNVRHAIAVMIRWSAQFESYLEVLVKEAAKNVDLFLRFSNAILNDLTFLIDESLTKANLLHEAQAELIASPNSNTIRRENLERQAGLARGLRTASVLGVQTITLISILALHTQDILMRPEMLDRVIQFINQYISKVSNPTRRQLISVVDAHSYSFHPLAWLKIFLDAYLSLARFDQPRFIAALVKDSSSLVLDDLTEALSLLESKKLLTASEVESLNAFSHAARVQSSENAASLKEEEELPEEFLDPLVSTLMEDPVLLPTSKMTIDRTTATRMLMNKPIDPFNRAPLTVDQLLPNIELKQRIQAYLERRRARHNARAAAATTSSSSSAASAASSSMSLPNFDNPPDLEPCSPPPDLESC